MSQQQGGTSLVNDGVVPWWIRLCRWVWKLAGFLGTAIILALFVNVASTWLTTSKGSIPSDSPFGMLLADWPIVLLIGCCLLLTALLTWAVSQWPPHPTVTPSLAQKNRAYMIGRLQHSYEALLAQSLQGIAWMDINLSEKPDAVRNAATLLLRSGNQPEHPLPAGTSILDVYDQAAHELLILGAPGSGKSTLLLELAQQLVKRAAHDAGQPLPVILPLSSWAVKRPRLQDWIAEQLTQIYDIPRRVSEQWVQEDTILPLLDGLDEMDEAARPAGIAAINTYHQIHLGVPLVICSRTAEYNAVTERQHLALQRAVIVQQLTSQQVDAYLLQEGKSVAALRSAMKKNHALQELATTPLMLSVLMLTYRGATARELSKRGVLLQQQIWTDYVARMVRRKGNEARYPLEQTRKWLIWLAQQTRAHQQTIFYAEHLHINWLPNKQRQTVSRLTIHIPALVLGVLAGMLVFLFVVGPFSLEFLLPIGLLGGFVGGCLARSTDPGTAMVGSHPPASKHVDLLSCMLLGVLVAASFGLSLGSEYALSDRIKDGCMLGLGSGLNARVFQILLFRRPRQQVSTRPSLQWRISAWFNMIAPQCVWQAALVLGAGIWLLVGLLVGRGEELDNGLLFGLINGLSVGMMVVLVSIVLGGSLKTIQFAESIHWRWQSLLRPSHLRMSLIVTGMVFFPLGLFWLVDGLSNGLHFGIGTGLGVGLINGLSNGLNVALSVGLCYWLILGLYQGVLQEHVEDQDHYQFNQGIRRSLRNCILVSLIGASIIAGMEMLGIELNTWLGYWLSYWMNIWLNYWLRIWLNIRLIFNLSDNLSDGLSSGLSVMWIIVISGFLLMWAMCGGLTVLRHYAIRCLLARSHQFPWHAQAFLDDATSRILLQRVGGGYRFMHRLLLDYFADLETALPSATSPKAAPMQQTPSS